MRLPATIVVSDPGSGEDATAIVRQLLDTLQPGDEVIVVDPGDGWAAPKYGNEILVRLMPAATTRSATLTAAMARAQNGIVALVAADAELGRFWLDELVAPFEDEGVAATGPLLIGRGTSQRLADDVSAESFPAWHEEWRVDHTDDRDVLNRLDRACIVLRRSVVEQLGGFVPVPTGCDAEQLEDFETDDLCRRLATAGYQLLLVQSVVVRFPHHDGEAGGAKEMASREVSRLSAVAAAGRRGMPLISASLIVKNEEQNLPSCLASLSGLVDEVVVYDTGSVDDTVAIARSAGATVIEGYWDDDFSRARNASADHCTGEWIVAVDADEVVTGDHAAARLALETAWSVDALGILITNLVGTNTNQRAGMDHRGPRVYRRARCQWRYRLHEQPAVREGQRPLRGAAFDFIRLLHSGYLDEAAGERNKIERNILVAERGLADLVDPTPADLAATLVNLGRSYLWGGRVDEAIETFRKALEHDGSETYRRAALHHGVDCLIHAGRLDEAEEWLADLETCSLEMSTAPRYLRSQLLLARGDAGGALELLDGMDAVLTEDGTALGGDAIAQMRGTAQLANGEYAAAADSLMAAAIITGNPRWSLLLQAVQSAGLDLSIVAGLVQDDRDLFAATVDALTLPPDLADAFYETLWEALGLRARLLAGAVRLAPHVGVGRALTWSARLRQAGAGDHCPLRAIVRDGAMPAGERLRAAAVLDRAFGERIEDPTLRRLAALVPSAELDGVVRDLHDLCPATAASIIAGAVAVR